MGRPKKSKSLRNKILEKASQETRRQVRDTGRVECTPQLQMESEGRKRKLSEDQEDNPQIEKQARDADDDDWQASPVNKRHRADDGEEMAEAGDAYEEDMKAERAHEKGKKKARGPSGTFIFILTNI